MVKISKHISHFKHAHCIQTDTENVGLLTCLTCSFLISFLRSASYFSFWFALAALWSYNVYIEMRLYKFCRYWFLKQSIKQMQDANIFYLLPNVFKLFYTFSYFFQTSVDLTCGNKRSGPTMLYKNLCNTKSPSHLVKQN